MGPLQILVSGTYAAHVQVFYMQDICSPCTLHARQGGLDENYAGEDAINYANSAEVRLGMSANVALLSSPPQLSSLPWSWSSIVIIWPKLFAISVFVIFRSACVFIKLPRNVLRCHDPEMISTSPLWAHVTHSVSVGWVGIPQQLHLPLLIHQSPMEMSDIAMLAQLSKQCSSVCFAL